eukprot:1557835-Lingulodinium_polyedra.AAC.1
MRSAIELIRCLDASGVPWILEHPASSKAWFLPEIESLLGRGHVTMVTTDFSGANAPLYCVAAWERPLTGPSA